MKSRKTGKTALKVVAITAGILVVGSAVGIVGLSNNYEPKAWPGTTFAGEVDLSGMTESEVQRAVDAWWEARRNETVSFDQGRLKRAHPSAALADLGVEFDRESALESVKYDAFWDDFRTNLGQEREKREFEVEPEYTFSEAMTEELAAFVEANQPDILSARIEYKGGEVVRHYGAAGMSLDASRLSAAVETAVLNDAPIEIPVKEAEKRIPDKELDRIKTVVSEFSTKFNAGQRSRSANIKRAAEMIDGMILMPGESFSFNGKLGKRTVEKGYHAAGVYVSGRHDIDVGGGICQVSTTLYNAVLKGELKVDTRFPHSLPVPYVPLGQDAAVSFPNPDFKFTNNYEFPIALAAIYEPGKLTFKVLGERENSREIKFETKYLSSWSHGEKVIHDGSLAPGVRKVVDKGGLGRKVHTWKVIYEGGKEVERIDLGTSTYRGGPVIVAVNKEAKKEPADAGGSEAQATGASEAELPGTPDRASG